MEFPDGIKYSKEHEWIKMEDDIATVGITDFAQDSLGDIVFLELPEVGKDVIVGESVCVVESVKSVSDVYTPLSGKIVEVNEKIEDEPELLNTNPYDKGWIYKIKISEENPELMDSSDYEDLVS